MPEKYQEEIEEILKGIERETPEETSTPETVRESTGGRGSIGTDAREAISRGQTNPLRRLAMSPGKLAIAGLARCLAGAVFSWTYLIWVGLAVMVGAYLMFFVRPKRADNEKIWRGRVVEDSPTWSDRVKRWLKN